MTLIDLPAVYVWPLTLVWATTISTTTTKFYRFDCTHVVNVPTSNVTATRITKDCVSVAPKRMAERWDVLANELPPSLLEHLGQLWNLTAVTGLTSRLVTSNAAQNKLENKV